jgi:hypothetical protein
MSSYAYVAVSPEGLETRGTLEVNAPVGREF